VIPVLAWPAAVLVGLSLGLLGAGGSILTVPLLHELVGLPMPLAVATSLPIVGAVAASATVAHARHGHVRLLHALPLAAASVVGAFAARTWVAPLLPPRVQEVCFALLMLGVAWRMAFRRTPGDDDRLEPSLPRAVATGLVAGAMTGVLGVGGGFLIVPALILSLGFDARTAVGTSLLVIALNCAASLLAERIGGAVEPRWDLAAVFGVVGVLGATAGARLSRRLPQVALRRTFAAVVAVLAVVLLASPA
jgi:uncharacterized membrane protein YfcA